MNSNKLGIAINGDRLWQSLMRLAQIGGNGVTKVSTSGALGTFTMSITGMAVGSNYSFVAYATNSGGTTYTSPVSTFTTLAIAPSISSPTIANITGVSAV